MNNEQRIIDEIGKLRKEVERLKRVESGGIWTDWTPTAVTGWSSVDTGVYRYAKVGKLGYLTVLIDGTSNATNAKITLPADCRQVRELFSGQTFPVQQRRFSYRFQTPDTALFELVR